MSSFRRIFAVAALLATAACGSEVVGQVEGWADRGCACRTTDCALEIRAEFTTWIEDKRSVRGSRTEKAKIEEAAKRLFKCLDKLNAATAEAAGGGKPDPEGD